MRLLNNLECYYREANYFRTLILKFYILALRKVSPSNCCTTSEMT